MTKVLYPGSFDPFTKGHANIVEQASYLFDEVVIAVLKNPSKRNSFFTIEERVEMIKELYSRIENIKVVTFNGAAVDLAALYECKAIVRGIRSITDTEAEIELAHINNDLSDKKVRTVCLFADNEYQHFSSSIVKGIDALDKSVSKYVEPSIHEKIMEKKMMRNG